MHSRDQFYNPHCCLTSYNTNLFINAPKLWNNLSEELYNIQSLNALNLCLKAFYKSLWYESNKDMVDMFMTISDMLR